MTIKRGGRLEEMRGVLFHDGRPVCLAASQGETGLGLYVADADCPTQDCVHTGTITRAGQSIVCLPARIIIRLEGGTVDRDAPDVVIG